ncbi:MAG TPA: chloride channel protein [Candidatus Acidoferrales bacterium]|nr:chloride channel protein [Candidatus Acidoferrales bacterium]
MADRQATPSGGGQRGGGSLDALAAKAAPLLARLGRLAEALTLRESQLVLLLAVLVGLLAGLAVVCFRVLIELTRLWLLGSALAPSPLRTVLVPAVAGLAVAVLVLLVFPLARGSGVNQTKAAVYIFDGYIPFRTVIGKFITCGLAIGAGFSLGPEDPSLQMGAGIASALGRRMRFSRDKLRLLAPVGAAAGLAAAFNAPIASVLFVIEEVIGTWSAGGLGAIVLAAVSSVVVMRLFLGAQPLFRVPPYRLASPQELLGYVVLGVAGGIASLVMLKFLAYFRPRLRRLPRWTLYAQPAAAGLLIGLVGLKYPQVMGAGYVYVDQALHGQYVWQVLGILGGLKILATSLSFVSGTPGGMFAPTLFIGAMLGGAVGGFEQTYFHPLGGSVGAFALVGMGTLFAGFLRVPITSVFIGVEVSGNYSIIIPVMISNTIAYLISRRYQKLPLFDLLSLQDGIELPSLEEQREHPSLRIEQAMRPPELPVLGAEKQVEEALAAMTAANATAVLVRFPAGRWVVADRDQLERRAQGDGRGRRLADVLPRDWVPHLHPDQPLDAALGPAQARPLLPIVSRADTGKLEGVLTLDDVLGAYRRQSARGDSGSSLLVR